MFILFSIFAIIPSAVECFAFNFPLNDSITRSAVSVTLHAFYETAFFAVIPAIFAGWGIRCVVYGNTADLIKAYIFYYAPRILVYLLNSNSDFLARNIFAIQRSTTPLIMIFIIAFMSIKLYRRKQK